MAPTLALGAVRSLPPSNSIFFSAPSFLQEQCAPQLLHASTLVASSTCCTYPQGLCGTSLQYNVPSQQHCPSAPCNSPHFLLAKSESSRKKLQRNVLCKAGNSGVSADDYYGLLGVSRRVDKAELKRAYRKLALVFHPDVNKDDGAQDNFVALSNAYEVLVDDQQRKLYDQYGVEGLKRQPNKSRGSAWEVWDEFKPMKKKKSRKQSARDVAAGASTSGSDRDEGNDGPAFAQNGDVVEFPLSPATRERMNDGREKGVGFIVGRNIDRGDKHKLSPENLTLCEVEVLWQEDGDDRWTVDPMESSAFADLLELRVLRSEFDRLSDSWKILDELSPGCGSPQYAEEVIL